MNYHMTQFEINKRCAELMGVRGYFPTMIGDNGSLLFSNGKEFNPCNNPADAWPIIEKCWDGLNLKCLTKYTNTEDVIVSLNNGDIKNRWELLMAQHQCTALEAACIYFIERGDL